MFIDAMGLILGDNKKITLGELSKPRALSAIPFGGRYRIIDYSEFRYQKYRYSYIYEV